MENEIGESTESNNVGLSNEKISAIREIIETNHEDIIHQLNLQFSKLIEEFAKATDNRNVALKNLIEQGPKVDNIEKLIRDFLDYGDFDNLVDYNFIHSDRTKRQLVIDNIMMEKHRLGLIDGSPNFAEFCKYEHHQFEDLLVYYFVTRFHNDVVLFNNFINAINSVYIKKTSYNKFEECTFSQKNTIFLAYKAINLAARNNENDRLAGIRGNIIKTRNEYLHRMTIIQSIEEEIMLKYNDLEFRKNKMIM
ncbi:hypothetical protein [Spirosoma areae]